MEQKKLDKLVSNLVNLVGNPIFVKDRKHILIYVNDSFCEFMHLKRDQVVGKGDPDFFPPDQVEVFWKKDEEVFNSKKPNINEEKITDSSGKIHTILTKKIVYKDEDGDEYIVGIITDITELKNKTEELEKINEALIEREMKMVELKKEIANLKSGK